MPWLNTRRVGRLASRVSLANLRSEVPQHRQIRQAPGGRLDTRRVERTTRVSQWNISSCCDANCCSDHGDLIGEAEAASEIVAEADDNSDQMDTEDSTQEMEDAGQVHQQETQPQV
jgi:hypothetical protein